jgi:chemotaxis protein CheD
MALGLGSCIGVCAFDPQAGVAGLAHVVLPESAGHNASPGKFADTAVPLLIEEMVRLGASPTRIRVALVGGAQLFAFTGTGSRLEIGPRNALAVQAALEQKRISVVATDLGGSTGRTVHLFADGRVRVKTIGQGEIDLVALGEVSPAASFSRNSQPAPVGSGVSVARKERFQDVNGS